MATTIGTESSIQDLVKNLLLLEHDAIAAYDATIKRLKDDAARRQIEAFREDHARHVRELTTIAGDLGIEAPKEGDMKQYLTTGKVAIAGLMGDGAVLKAMKTNEDDTVTAYERASTHEDAIPKTREVFARALADERRHREYMERQAERL